ncbi:MAG: DUF4199 domain-containing protein [Rhodocyclaceae bacterium]
MEESLENTSDNNLYKDALKLGAILGGINIVMTILIYIADYSFLATFKMLFLIIVVHAGVVIFGGIRYRRSVGGYLSFGKAYIHGLITLAVSGLIATIFGLVLYSLIDPELGQKLTDIIAENTEAFMQKLNAPAAEIEKAIDKIKQESPNDFKPLGQVKNFFKILIFNAILCLITGAIVKKNQPVKF